MPSPRVEWTSPGPVASAFFHSKAPRSVILGPFGSGKSVTCCTKIMRHVHEQKPWTDGVRRSRWVAARNTYAELKLTTKKTWEDWFGHPEWGRIIEAAPFQHRLDFGLDDGTKVEAELIFLALDREEDVRKLLSLELTGIWFNEMREARRQVVEAADGRLGRYPSMAQGGPSWYGMIGDTNMPDEDHWLRELAEVEHPEGWAFFKQPGGLYKSSEGWVAHPAAENTNNLVSGYYTRQLSGKSEQWISVYLGAEYGRIPEDGAYYTDELIAAERDKRIVDALILDPHLPVHTFWDLGVAGNMVVWFAQVSNQEWRWVDYHEMEKPGLPHAAQVLKDKQAERGFMWGTHVWPHDGSATDMGSGEIRSEMFAKLGFRPVVLPNPGKQGIGDGIEATRRVLRMSKWDRERCAKGLNHLRRYRRKFDKVRNIFIQEPDHSEHSHAADAKRTAAMGQSRLGSTESAKAWADFKWEFKAA